MKNRIHHGDTETTRFFSPCLRASVVNLLFLACASNVPGIEPKDGEIRFPVGIAVHPAGRHLFVASSNFDLLYNGSTVGVVDLTTNTYATGHTIKIGSFAADLVINAAGTTLFVPEEYR